MTDRSRSWRVMTLNLLHGPAPLQGPWSLRCERFVQLVEREHPDVIGLQEASAVQIADLAAALPQFACSPGARSGARWARVLVVALLGLLAAAWLMRAQAPRLVLAGRMVSVIALMPVLLILWSLARLGSFIARGEHCPVFWRRAAFDLEADETRWLSGTPSVPGSAPLSALGPCIVHRVRLRHTRGEGACTVHVTHVGHASWLGAARARALLRELAAAPETEPVVLCGDFNAAPGSTLIRHLLSACDPPLRGARAVAAQVEGAAATWPSSRPVLAVDHVFVRGARVARWRSVAEPALSDHAAVVVELEHGDPPARPGAAGLVSTPRVR